MHIMATASSPVKHPRRRHGHCYLTYLFLISDCMFSLLTLQQKWTFKMRTNQFVFGNVDKFRARLQLLSYDWTITVCWTVKRSQWSLLFGLKSTDRWDNWTYLDFSEEPGRDVKVQPEERTCHQHPRELFLQNSTTCLHDKTSTVIKSEVRRWIQKHIFTWSFSKIQRRVFRTEVSLKTEITYDTVLNIMICADEWDKWLEAVIHLHVWILKVYLHFHPAGKAPSATLSNGLFQYNNLWKSTKYSTTQCWQ